MIKKKWGDLLETFKESTVKLVTRKLPSREAEKCERLLDEQRRLADNLARAFALFDAKLHKVSSYIERCMEGETDRLEPYVKKLQQDLASAIARADLAISDMAELERELADWQRNPTAKADDSNSRLNSLRVELEARRPSIQRCALTPNPSPTGAGEGLSDTPFACSVGERSRGIEGSVRSAAEQHGSIAYVEVRSADMEPDAESLAQHIKDLSRELGRYQHAPDADPRESLRMAGQIRNLHTILRRVDKRKGDHRDRIGTTDGFRHVFLSH